MKNWKLISSYLFLAALLAGLRPTGASLAAPAGGANAQSLPPILILDDEFLPADWTTTAETSGGGSFTVSQQGTGGFGSPPFRFMSHRLPPVSGTDLASVVVTHLSNTATYDPSIQGEITAIDYQEAGRILSFPFPEAFSTTQPALRQGGRTFRSSEFIRFIAQNGSHNWETKGLSQLTAMDFVAVDDSGDHPDFSTSGAPIQFGFTRTNARSSTLPPVPAGQDMVIDQGVDHWQLIIHRQAEPDVNQPPQAVDDVFILDGNQRSLPIFEIFDVVRNDSDPDRDSLEVSDVTQPTHGSAGILSQHTIVYTLDVAQAFDQFDYTLSDGDLTGEAQVQIYIDCACSVLCLNSLELPEVAGSQTATTLDLPLIYRLRDRILKTTPHGHRYVKMYYSSNPEILVNLMLNAPLREEALAVVQLWQENLRSLVDGDGSVTISQTQVTAIHNFLDHLSAASSPELQQIIADELGRLGPLDSYVGLSMKEAKKLAIGDAILYLPVINQSQP
jgi:hypothetical protein